MSTAVDQPAVRAVIAALGIESGLVPGGDRPTPIDACGSALEVLRVGESS